MVEEAGAPRAACSSFAARPAANGSLQRFREMGADVVVVCAYVRLPLELSNGQIAELIRGMTNEHPVVYVTSTDAVDVLMHALRPIPGARATG